MIKATEVVGVIWLLKQGLLSKTYWRKITSRVLALMTVQSSSNTLPVAKALDMKIF